MDDPVWSWVPCPITHKCLSISAGDRIQLHPLQAWLHPVNKQPAITYKSPLRRHRPLIGTLVNLYTVNLPECWCIWVHLTHRTYTIPQFQSVMSWNLGRWYVQPPHWADLRGGTRGLHAQCSSSSSSSSSSVGQ